MGKTRAAYPPEFRQMVELVRAGPSPEELAVSSNRRHSRSGTGWPSVSITPPRRRRPDDSRARGTNRLRRENRQLRLEREILSKAAAWFARETNAIPPGPSRFWVILSCVSLPLYIGGAYIMCMIDTSSIPEPGRIAAHSAALRYIHACVTEPLRRRSMRW